MKIFICKISVLLCLIAPCCNGARVDDLQKKIYSMETSLSQDIKILRDTVETNTNEIQKFGALINETVSHLTDMDASEITKHRSATLETADTRTSYEIKRITDEVDSIAEDVVRVKRAFSEEKGNFQKEVENVKSQFREVETNINGKLDAIIGLLNKQNNDIINMLVTKISDSKEETIANITILMESHQSDFAEDNARLSSSVTTPLEDIKSKTEQIELTLAAHNASADGYFNKLTVASEALRTQTDHVATVNDKILATVSSMQKHVRLVRGVLIEVQYNGQWGTVCDDNFADNNNGATVVCRQLGFTSGIYKAGTSFGVGSGPIWFDDVQCSGSESSIFDCPRVNNPSIGEHNCKHIEDAGVVCS